MLDGEMLFLEPVAGSFAVYAHKYMNPYFGYLTARGYWFMGLPSAFLKSPPSGWRAVLSRKYRSVPALIAAMVALANGGGGAPYGELEFWFRHDQGHHHHRDDSGGAGVIGFGNGGEPIGFAI